MADAAIYIRQGWLVGEGHGGDGGGGDGAAVVHGGDGYQISRVEVRAGVYGGVPRRRGDNGALLEIVDDVRDREVGAAAVRSTGGRLRCVEPPDGDAFPGR